MDVSDTRVWRLNTEDRIMTKSVFHTPNGMDGDFIYRYHIEPRVQVHVPKVEIFPIKAKYIDVIRTTHTNLDVLQESCIDDYWMTMWIHLMNGMLPNYVVE